MAAAPELDLATLLRVAGGALDVREAEAAGLVRREGSLRVLRDLPKLFEL